MAESIVQVTEGTGKKLHTWQRTVGVNNVEDEFVIPGEYPLASYNAFGANVSTATAASHLLELMAGASLNVRVRRIVVILLTPPAAVTVTQLQVFRLTTAGTGGTAITPAKLDSADAASGATAMTLAAVKGTESTEVIDASFVAGTAALPGLYLSRFEWTPAPGMKSLIIPAGAANGIAIKNTAAIAAASVDVSIEFVETSFV